MVATGLTFGGSKAFSHYSISQDELDDGLKRLDAYYRMLSAQSKAAARDVTSVIDAYLYDDDTFTALSEEAQRMISGVVGSLDPEYIFKHKNIGSLWQSIVDIITPLDQALIL